MNRHHSGSAGAAHQHGVSRDVDRRYLSSALLLIVGFMAVEVVVGFIAGSLALISDAAHMLTDAAAIGLALVAMRLVAMRLAARPAKGAYTYGLKRAEILFSPSQGDHPAPQPENWRIQSLTVAVVLTTRR